jgi:hypothetical protein
MAYDRRCPEYGLTADVGVSGSPKPLCGVRARRRTALVEPRQERQARNEALVRQVNEQIERVDRAAEETGSAVEPTVFEFFCECGAAEDGDIACEARIEMTLAEYEEIRRQDDRFAVTPGHENHALEEVVRRTDRFVVVDKKPSAEPFVNDDPRGATSG